MKYIILFLFFNLFCFSQTKYEGSGAEKVQFAKSQLEAEYLAKEDINNQNIYIFLQGGITPIVYPTDKYFEKSYKIIFNEEGCTGSEYSKYYNCIIFNYLTKTFGNKWTKEIRKDANGFKEWKKKKLKPILNI